MTQQDVDRDDRTPRRREREHLRRRLRYEREIRGWSRQDLASALQRAACYVSAQDIYNMEKQPAGRTPRVVKVDELAALAEIFELPLADLLLPPEEVLPRAVASILEELGQAQRELVKAYRALQDPLQRLVLLLTANDLLRNAINTAARFEGVLSELVFVALELDERLRTGEITTTGQQAIIERRHRGQHQQAP